MKILFTVTEVAEMLRCTEETVELESRDGRLPGLKIGRAWVFPVDALTSKLNERATAEMLNRAAPPKAKALPQPMIGVVAEPGAQRKAANSSRARPRPDLSHYSAKASG